MTAAEVIRILTSGDASAVIAVAAEAASLIEAQEERIAIMGEVLTDKEYRETEQAARARVEGRIAAGQ